MSFIIYTNRWIIRSRFVRKRLLPRILILVFSFLNRHVKEEKQLAAFGSEMEKLVQLIKEHPNIKLYLPESFEWLILCSGLIEGHNVSGQLKHPEEYIESKIYFSWERYFTAQLVELTQESFLKYAKKQLNPAYVQGKIMDKILNVMKGIEIN